MNKLSLDATVVSIDGLKVHALTLEEATRQAIRLSAGDVPALVVTPNTDHFLRWQTDGAFRALYSRAAMVVADGMPLVWLSKLDRTPLPERVTGIDLFSAVCERAAELGLPVAIVGGGPGVAGAAADRLIAVYPTLNVCLTASPGPEQLQDPSYVAQLAVDLNNQGAKIIALCLGSPKQEQLFAALEPLLQASVSLGVGAAVDFWAGRIRRSPRWLQHLGLEWAWRLASDPRRLWRRYILRNSRILSYIFRASVRHLGVRGSSN